MDETEQLLQKKFLDFMFNLESDEMTALWPNDSITFTFCMTFSNIILNWTIFLKKFFDPILCLEIDEMTALWQNDSLTFPFYQVLIPECGIIT